MEALPKIAPDDEQVIKALIEMTQLASRRGVSIRRDGQLAETSFRDSAVELLGIIAEAQPKTRKQIVPPLVAFLKAADERTIAAEGSNVRVAITELTTTGDALLKCGAEAKDALNTEILAEGAEVSPFCGGSQSGGESAEEDRERKVEDGGQSAGGNRRFP